MFDFMPLISEGGGGGGGDVEKFAPPKTKKIWKAYPNGIGDILV